MTRFGELFRTLASAEVVFLALDGVAAAAHGAHAPYLRGPHAPYLRGAPQGLPFCLDVPTLEAGLNFTPVTNIAETNIAETNIAVTNIGCIDLPEKITGGGRYQDLLPHSIVVRVRAQDFEGLADHA